MYRPQPQKIVPQSNSIFKQTPMHSASVTTMHNTSDIFSKNLAGQNSQPEYLKTVSVPYSGTQQSTTDSSVVGSNSLETEAKKISVEFENLIREKLGKIDDILIALKERQEPKPVLLKSQNHPEHFGGHDNNIHSNPEALTESKKAPEQAPRSKKTYYGITESMWGEIKDKYKELADEHRNHTFSDGTNYYVEVKNKKILLDGKGFLKILNLKK
jgi:hypothetical protein